MIAFKFTIPPLGFRHLPDDPSIAFAGCSAIVIAETEAEARREVALFAQANDLDARWIAVADVTPMPIDATKVISFVMF